MINSNKITYYLTDVMNKFAANRHVMAIRDGILASMAASLVGSVFLILRFLPIKAWTNFIESNKLGEYLLYPIAANTDMLGIIILLAIAYRLAESYRLEPLGACLTAFTAYLLVTPLKILVDIPGAVAQMSVAGIPIAAMGTKGLFVAMIISILSVEIYHRVIEANWVIKMPDSVPPSVAKPFMAVVPSLVVILVVLAIRLFFENTGYGTLNNFIQKILSAPLTNGVKSLTGAVSYAVVYVFFWWFGIHGSIADVVYAPAWTIISDENRLAFQTGQELPNIMTQLYLSAFSRMGGSGSTLGFVFLCLFRAKSTHLKQVGKLSLGPGIFQINEPILFGVPIVLNPIMMIPFIFTTAILAANAYIWIALGLVPKPTGVILPWTMPCILNAYILSNGSIRAVLLQLLNLVIATACYYPFFKIIDKNYVTTELAKNKV